MRTPTKKDQYNWKQINSAVKDNQAKNEYANYEDRRWLEVVRDEIVNVYSDEQLRDHKMFAPLPMKREPKIEISKFD